MNEEKLIIPAGLHNYLHQKGVYTLQGIRGASLAFQWMVTKLSRSRRYSFVMELIQKWNEMLKSNNTN